MLLGPNSLATLVFLLGLSDPTFAGRPRRAAPSPRYLSWRNPQAFNLPTASFYLFDSPSCFLQTHEPETQNGDANERDVLAFPERTKSSVMVLSFDGLGPKDFEDVERTLGKALEQPRDDIGKLEVFDALRRTVECGGTVEVTELDQLRDLLDPASWINVELLAGHSYTVLSSFTPAEIALLREEAHIFESEIDEDVPQDAVVPASSHDTVVEEDSQVTSPAAEDLPLGEMNEAKVEPGRVKTLLRDLTNGWMGVVLGLIWFLGALAVCRRVTKNHRSGKKEDSEMGSGLLWDVNEEEGKGSSVSIDSEPKYSR